MNTQQTPKEALDQFRSRNQLKAPEPKPKQVELGLLGLLDVLGQLIK